MALVPAAAGSSWIPSLVAGAGSLLGGLFGGSQQASAQEATNASNERINQQNIAWQTDMSNTAVSRRARDMQNAGINPILAAGNPASQPSASMIPMQNPKAGFGQLGQSIGSSAGSALALSSQIALNQAQARKTNADASVVEQQAPHSGEKAFWEVENLRSQYDNLGQTWANLIQTNHLTAQQIENQQLTNDQLKAIQPLLIEKQKLDNRASQLGLSEKNADAKFWDQAGDTGKLLPRILEIIKTARGH